MTILQVHTSKLFHGQVYMPLANWLLMIGCVVVTAAYSNVSANSELFSYLDILIQDRQRDWEMPTEFVLSA
jgi:hypothetical protein